MRSRCGRKCSPLSKMLRATTSRLPPRPIRDGRQQIDGSIPWSYTSHSIRAVAPGPRVGRDRGNCRHLARPAADLKTLAQVVATRKEAVPLELSLGAPEAVQGREIGQVDQARWIDIWIQVEQSAHQWK